jgi:hypothetical protein
MTPAILAGRAGGSQGFSGILNQFPVDSDRLCDSLGSETMVNVVAYTVFYLLAELY